LCKPYASAEHGSAAHGRPTLMHACKIMQAGAAGMRQASGGAGPRDLTPSA